MKLKLKKDSTAGQTALQRFDTAFLRNADKLNPFKIALNNRFLDLQDHLRRKSYYGGQMEMDRRSINFNVLGGAGLQEASS
ncbi:unnamed protein product [Schistosoma margrebowiei]|uniref:Uncharacterized protein n=1 Tax=Schistosoma margrebowiei TaxID=48269 RepID=A0A183MZY0_9TREM|nr:unnamed protein product [Schistosoma margrebowiei]